MSLVPAPSSPPRTGLRRGLSLAFVSLAVVVIVMDGSIVNVALPTLATKLEGATNSRLQWVVDAYILSFAALLLTSGSAADRLGRRRLLLAGLATFAVVSIGAAYAGGMPQLITWRVLMGVGAALIFPPTLAIITEDFPEPALRRGAIAVWAGSSGLGVAIGPVAGGWLLERFHWSSIFLVNVPVVVAAMIGIRLFAPESRDTHPRRLDPIGGVLAIVGILCLVWGLIEAPERGWASLATLAALAAGVGVLAAFVLWELRTPSPMLDMRSFLDRRFSGGCAAIAAAFFGLFGFVFMVTQYFQFLRGYDALAAGIRTMPFAGFILLGAVAAARWTRTIGPRGIIVGGLLLMAFGFAWATRDDVATEYWLMVCQMGVLGTGLGLVNAAATESIMASLPLRLAGTGSSVNDTLREVGGTLGVAGMGSAFNALYRGDLGPQLATAPLPTEAKELLRSSVGAAATVIARVEEVAGPAAAALVRTPVESAFLGGFRASCWIACAATCAGALAVAILLRRRREWSVVDPAAESAERTAEAA